MQFLVAGVVLFAVYRVLNPYSETPSAGNRIVITQDDLRQMQIAWRAQWQRFPTPEELRGLVDNKIREEILYREAVALGLDKDDSIVKRRLAQKMNFLADDISSLREPQGDELKLWFEKYHERFASPTLVSFHHIYFSPDRRGAHANNDASAALIEVAGRPDNKDASREFGDAFMFQDYYSERTSDQVAGIFGMDFTKAVFSLKPGSWQGPFESGLGWHLVFVDSLLLGRVPAFEEVAADVKARWSDEQRIELRDRSFELMKARYEIVFPAGAVEASSFAHEVTPGDSR